MSTVPQISDPEQAMVHGPDLAGIPLRNDSPLSFHSLHLAISLKIKEDLAEQFCPTRSSFRNLLFTERERGMRHLHEALLRHSSDWLHLRATVSHF